MELQTLPGMTSQEALDYVEKEAPSQWSHLDASRFYLAQTCLGGNAVWALYYESA